jgi:hypothetical protein
MTLSRHQKALEKMHAVRATKRFQAAQVRSGKENESVVSEASVGGTLDSKPSEEYDNSILATSIVVTDNEDEDVLNVPDLPVNSRVDEAEPQQERKTASDPNEESPNIVFDGRQDGTQESPGTSSPKAHRKFPDGDQTPKSKTMSRLDEKKETAPSPPRSRRFDIVEDEPPRKPSKTNKASLRKSSRGRKSKRSRRSKRVRIKERSIDDDASSVDSQLESFLSEDRPDVASALDHIFDFFTPMDDLRSLDDSCSERTDRTDESYLNMIFSSKSRGGLLKEVEELFIDRFSCGPSIPECHHLGTPTFSYAEDESTVSGNKERKVRSKKHHARSMRSSGRKAKETDMLSFDSSAIPEDEETVTDTGTLTTNGESLATSAYDTDKDIGRATSFDTEGAGAGWRNPCNMAECLGETAGAHEDNERKKKKIRELLSKAKRRAEKATKDLKNETSNIFSRADSPSITSTLMSSLRGATTPTGDENAMPFTDGGTAFANGESAFTDVGTAFTNADTTFTDTGTAFTDGTGHRTVDTQSVIQPTPEEVGALSNNQNDTSNEVYAPAQAIKPSSSFYSVETPTSQKNPESAFQKALGKLRDDTVLATKRLQSSLGGLDFAPAGNVSIAEKVKQVFTCSPGPDQMPLATDETETPVEESKKVTPGERVKRVLTCTAIPREDSGLVNNGLKATVEAGPETNEQAEDSAVDDLVEDQQGAEQPEDAGIECSNDPAVVLKPVADGDSETKSVETKDTSRSSTEDEAEHERPEDVEFEYAPVTESSEYQETSPPQEQIPQDKPAETTETIPPKKKWGKLRRMSKLVRPLFGTKKHGAKHSPESTPKAPVPFVYDSEDIRNSSADSCVKSLTSQLSSDQNTSSSSKGDSAPSPFDPSLSTKAKREAWRSTKADEFDEIISNNARVNDWNHVFPELIVSDAADSVTDASF